MIQTICKHCVFKIGSPQTGCKLNRLDRFIKKGNATLTEDYYTINRFCNTCRMDETSIEAVKKQVELKVCAFIFCDGVSAEDLTKTLNSLKKQTIVPNIVYCVFQSEQSLPGIFKDNYEDFKLLDSNFNMKINYEPTTIELAINEVLEKTQKKSTYLLCVRPGDVISPRFIEDSNNVINEDMESIHIFESVKDATVMYSYSSLIMYGYESVVNREIQGLEDFTCSI